LRIGLPANGMTAAFPERVRQEFSAAEILNHY
jgi:hypothetical protein